MMWEQNGTIVTVFSRGGLPPPPTIPSYTVVSTKLFLCDAKCGKIGEVAFVGLIQSSLEGVSTDMTATCGTLSADLVGSASDQEALECILAEFANIFEKPG